MADFTALTIDAGVGDIHLNRFRIAFRPPAGIPAKIRAQTLASDLIDHFPNTSEVNLRPSNSATAAIRASPRCIFTATRRWPV